MYKKTGKYRTANLLGSEGLTDQCPGYTTFGEIYLLLKTFQHFNVIGTLKSTWILYIFLAHHAPKV